jgi:hypothetical protein
MKTSGHGNDALLILVPIGVSVFAGVVLFGGPADALEAMNAIVGEVARAAMAFVSALL